MSVISELLIKIGADTTGLDKGMQDAKRSIDKAMDPAPIKTMQEAMGGITSTLGKAATAMGAFTVAAGSLGGLRSLVTSAIQAGSNVHQLAERLSITYGEAVKLSRILSLTGGDASTFTSAMTRLDKTVTSANEQGERARAILAAVGSSMTDESGKLLTLNSQLESLAAGYRKAYDAGYGQEFLMNTLGVKGLALADTLREYSEAAERASKIKGIGIDPLQMDRMQKQLELVDMETKQVGLAFGNALAPVVGEMLPSIMSGLSDTASFLARNKNEIAGVTKATFNLLSAIAVIKATVSAGNFLGGLWRRATATAIVAEETLTAEQEKAIARRISIIEREANRREQLAIKTAIKESKSAEETAARIEIECGKIEKKAQETASKVRLAMTEAFRKSATAAQESSASTVTAMEKEASAATAAAASASKSKALSAAATAKEAEANAAVIVSENEKGIAATAAGEKSVKAKGESTLAAKAETAAVNETAAAEARAGAASLSAGGNMVKSTGRAIPLVKGLTDTVWALAGGWLGVAAAIGYATYKLLDWKKEKAEDEQNRTYYIDGQKYIEKDGTFYESSYSYDDMDVDSMPSVTEREVTDESRKEQLNSAWFERHKDDDDYVAQLEDEERKAEQEKSRAEIEALMAELQGGVGDDAAASAAKSPEAKTYTETVPIGLVALENAQSHLEDDADTLYDASAGVSEQCAAFLSSIYGEELGIEGLYSVRGDVLEERFRDAGAYHDAGGDYVPRVGDMIEWDNHVGMYAGDGQYIARNSTGGVHQGYMSEAEDYGFGNLVGYGSIDEYTGNMTISRTTDSDTGTGKRLQELARAGQDFSRLYTGMQQGVLKSNGTTYEQDMFDLLDDVQRKQQEIRKLSARGIDDDSIKRAEDELAEYTKAKLGDVKKKRAEALEDMRDSTRSTLSEVTSDYEAAAEAQYKATVDRLDRERDDKEKAVMRDKEDTESLNAVNEWYEANRRKAQKELEKSRREAHNRRLSDLMEEGNLAAVMEEMGSPREQEHINLDGQQKLANEYVSLWREAHKSIYGEIAEAGANLYSSLTDSIKGFISGTKSAMDIVHDFGNAILSELARIAAQRLAANIIGGLLGGAMRGSSGGYNIMTGGGFFNLLPFRDGGEVEVPRFAYGGIKGKGNGRSDSIIALVSNGEYIMTAKAAAAYAPILDAMNAGKFADGGYVTAPSLSSGGGYVPSGLGGMRGGVVVNIINNTSDTEAKVQETRYDDTLGQTVCDIVLDHAQRNVGGFGTNMRTALGAK